MRRLSIAGFVLAFAALLAACTSHGLQSMVPGAPGYARSDGDDGTSAAAKVTVSITIATKSASSDRTRERRPHYFSSSSRGLLVNAYVHGKRKVIGHAVVDISPGSVACDKKKTTPRTCTATLTLPVSTGDDFTLFDYSTKPVANKIPKSAHIVGYGRLVNKKVAASAKKNRFTVYLGGVIESLNAGPSVPIAFLGDAQLHTAALMIDPLDFGNNPITAGVKDPYANPIGVKVVETGGTGHTHLSLNGGAGTGSVALKYSTDTVEITYDGGGPIGYGAQVQLSSAKVKNTGGARAVVAIAPFILGTTSGDYSPGAIALKGNGDYAKFEMSEVNAPAGTKFTVSTQHCDAIESTTVFPQASSSSGSFAVIARGVAATPNPAGCGIVVSDGALNFQLTIGNTYSGSLGSLPVISTTPIPQAEAWPVQLTVGPDGAVWFAECNGAALGRVGAAPPSASNPIHEYALPVASPTAGPAGAFSGPDGNLWFTDQGTGNVGKMTTSGSVFEYPAVAPTDEPAAVTVGSDGNMWFTNWSAKYIGTMPAPGPHPTPYSTNLTSVANNNIALGPDGNLWFTEGSTGAIGKITPSGAITEFLTPSGAHSDPWDITAGPDGAMWFTECYGGAGNGAIGRIPVTASSGSDIQEFSMGMTGHQPVDITTGPDGALWFVYWNAAAVVGRITTAATPSTTTITEYPIPGASASYNGWGITSGPDGAIWFSDNIDNVIGRIAIASTPAIGRANRVHRIRGAVSYPSARARIQARHHGVRYLR